VGGFSLGMRQRLGLAAALMRRPGVLLLDEPANGLDPAGADELWQVVRELAADLTAVLLSSHDLVAIDDVCDEITVLREGEVAWSGAIVELRALAPAPEHVCAPPTTAPRRSSPAAWRSGGSRRPGPAGGGRAGDRRAPDGRARPGGHRHPLAHTGNLAAADPVRSLDRGAGHDSGRRSRPAAVGPRAARARARLRVADVLAVCAVEARKLQRR